MPVYSAGDAEKEVSKDAFQCARICFTAVDGGFDVCLLIVMRQPMLSDTTIPPTHSLGLFPGRGFKTMPVFSNSVTLRVRVATPLVLECAMQCLRPVGQELRLILRSMSIDAYQ